MNQDELGLPVEYQKHPEYFDAFNVSEHTARINELVANLLGQYEAQTVLDMACGTGAQVFYLHELGYEVTGSDVSPALLEQAREKAVQANLNIKFVDGDMRILQLGPADSVITIDNAIGHLTKHEFQTALKTIHSNLHQGGVYLFDILNYSAMTEQALKNDTSHHFVTIEDKRIHAVQFSTIDHKQQRLIAHHYDVIQQGLNKPYIEQSCNALQVYTQKELTKLLDGSGFDIMAMYDREGNAFIDDQSFSMLTIAKKR